MDDRWQVLFQVGKVAFSPDRIAKDERLACRARIDALTKLPSRMLLLGRLSLQLQARRAGPDRLGVLVDTERFSVVNDTHGPPRGRRGAALVRHQLYARSVDSNRLT
ncbi:diguanylate cyclase domain-containing protein [Azohydromonas aeria]|uniref:diguanylate cyclase domain-containing protein n=1 Tax=Azohydromonas aeria TaxID=2590212 RepID=UPI0012F768F3|nr:diguanylate cyclase [Azohydromonas aeria]